MSAHIDWMSVTLPLATAGEDWTIRDTTARAVNELRDRCGSFIEAFGSPLDWQPSHGRAPYSISRRSDDGTRALYLHPELPYFTFEASGQACQKARHYMTALCTAFDGLFTRLDLAVDIETDVTPSAFAEQAKPPLIKTRSVMQSSTGETVYIGSRTSEKFVRIYRYNAPHPRAHLLRAEFQLKKAYANGLARRIVDGVTLESLASGFGQQFHFKHPCWNVSPEPTRIKVASHAQSGNTIAWLTQTVAPLMRRLQAEGRLDVEAWIAEYVTSND